jgi:hypothetical protein
MKGNTSKTAKRPAWTMGLLVTGLLVAWFLLSACNRYIAYKTAVRGTMKSAYYDSRYRKQTAYYIKKYQDKNKEFILSLNGNMYSLSGLKVDDSSTMATAAIDLPQRAPVSVYHPSENKRGPNSLSVYKGAYNKDNGEQIVLNQVFLVSDSAVIRGDSVSLSLSSISRIDKTKKDNGVEITILTFLGMIVLLLVQINNWGLVSSRTNGQEGCFIATACYGDYDAAEVHVLRRYRDETLLCSRAGRLFVRIYYRISPPLANLISRSGRLKRVIRRGMLQPLVAAIQRRRYTAAATAGAGHSQAILPSGPCAGWEEPPAHPCACLKQHIA